MLVHAGKGCDTGLIEKHGVCNDILCGSNREYGCFSTDPLTAGMDIVCDEGNLFNWNTGVCRNDGCGEYGQPACRTGTSNNQLS